MKIIKWAIAVVASFSLASCGLPETYVMADRDTFMAVAPEYTSYVMLDPTLSDSDRKIRVRTITIWEQRLDAAEKAVVK